MPRREKMLLCAGAVFLVLLFLMSSTDLIIKERAVQIDSISVILSEDTDDYYQNFRKGMEKAATDLRSDVRLITLYDRKDQDQQVELTTREIRDGAGAVVILKPEGYWEKKQQKKTFQVKKCVCLPREWLITAYRTPTKGSALF